MLQSQRPQLWARNCEVDSIKSQLMMALGSTQEFCMNGVDNNSVWNALAWIGEEEKTAPPTDSGVYTEVSAWWCRGIHLSPVFVCPGLPLRACPWCAPVSIPAFSLSACRTPGHLGMQPTKWGHVGPLELNSASRFQPFSARDIFLRICLFADLFSQSKTNCAWITWLLWEYGWMISCSSWTN